MTTGAHGGVAGDGLGGVAVQPGAALAAGLGRERPARGPLLPDLRGPLLLQRRIAVEQHQVGQRDVHPGLDRLPGALGQQVGGHEPPHGFGQRVVIPLLPGPVVLLPGWSAQRVQDLPDHLGAFGGQVSVDDPGPTERGGQLETAVLERGVRVLIGQLGAGPFVHLRGQRRQLFRPQPRLRRRHEELIGMIPQMLRELVGPQADQPADRFRDLPGSQSRHDSRMRAGPLGPRRVPHRRAAGDMGLMDQPRPGAVGRVVGVPLRGRERSQERRPSGRPDRISLLDHLQATGLGRGAQLGGIGRGEVAQRGTRHLHRLVSTGEDRGGTHPGHLLH